MLNEKRYEFEIEGVKCFFSTGLLARKSQSAVFAQMGETSVLATINCGAPMPDSDFFPLSVEYMEKMYAAGKISGSRFVKRDRFPSDDAVLSARVIDRSIRPRFPADYRNEVLVVVKVLSYDPQYDPVVLAINAVFAALVISPAPITEPISGVRVGMVDEQLVSYNKHLDRDNQGDTKLNLVVAGDGNSFTNIDSDAFELSEDKYIEAMEYGLKLMRPWLEAQKKFVELVGEIKKSEYTSFAIPQELVGQIDEKYGEDIRKILFKDIDPTEVTKDDVMTKIQNDFGNEYPKRQLSEAFDEVMKKSLQSAVLKDGKRYDGRALDEIRQLDTKVGILPRVHGSGLFSRGLTQVMTVATLGSSRSQQMVDDMTGEDERRYLHYYVEAPHSFGEVGRVKYIPGRREVGHGALAEKAMYPVLPTMEQFPYTIMLMSEVMSEEGSSSMGCTCGSTLALMDAGVPITKPVAGIAMGVILADSPSEFKILTDIRSYEDFYGYMDFKVAGTKDGITAVQMDTKSAGLPIEVFKSAIVAAKEARMKILEVMAGAIAQPRVTVSKHAPKVIVVKIPVGKIGALIGPGGKVIREITETTGAEINVEEDGTVHIFALETESIERAKQMVGEVAFEAEVGKVYTGKVTGVVEFGAFVEIAKGASGLLHVSEFGDGFVKNVHDHVNEGDVLEVKVIGVDREGKIKLSRKGLTGGNSNRNVPSTQPSDGQNTPHPEKATDVGNSMVS